MGRNANGLEREKVAIAHRSAASKRDNNPFIWMNGFQGPIPLRRNPQGLSARHGRKLERVAINARTHRDDATRRFFRRFGTVAVMAVTGDSEKTEYLCRRHLTGIGELLVVPNMQRPRRTASIVSNDQNSSRKIPRLDRIKMISVQPTGLFKNPHMLFPSS
jgi:hypothetical protein